MTNKAINIIFWNTNSVNQHKNELLNFLNENKIHIALITETHLTKSIKFKLPGYSIYQADHSHNTAHAGAAITILTNIKHSLHYINS